MTNSLGIKYLKENEDTYTGFNNVSIQDKLTYMCDKYREVTPNELEEVEKTLNEPFNPFAPFGAYI